MTDCASNWRDRRLRRICRRQDGRIVRTEMKRHRACAWRTLNELEYASSQIEQLQGLMRGVVRLAWPNRSAPSQEADGSRRRYPPGTHITVRGLVKQFGANKLYDGFDLDIPKGKIISIFGPNS